MIRTPVLVSGEKTRVFRGSQFSLENTRPEDLIADSNHSYNRRSIGTWLELVVRMYGVVRQWTPSIPLTFPWRHSSLSNTAICEQGRIP